MKEAEIDAYNSVDQNALVANKAHFPNMYQKYRRVDVNDLDYLNSEHAMAIQNSIYVKIEDNRERILQQKLQATKKNDQSNSLQIEGRKGGFVSN